MPQWFLRGLRRGVVTTHYPARLDPSAADLPSPPAFRAHALTRQTADILVAICPSGALARSGFTLVLDIGACTACGECVSAAPHAAAPSREFELAATDRDSLRKRVPLLGEGAQ